jgi:hypothetical protein
MQAAFYLLAVAGGAVPALQRLRLVRVTHYFALVQWAMLVAWVRFALGQQQTTWEPSQRDAIPQGAPPSS